MLTDWCIEREELEGSGGKRRIERAGGKLLNYERDVWCAVFMFLLYSLLSTFLLGECNNDGSSEAAAIYYFFFLIWP